MKTFYRCLSYAGLAVMFAAAILVFKGRMSERAYRVAAMIGTVAWFATVPLWMRRRLHHPAAAETK